MGYWTGRKVLVTGGNGFLGHHVVASLRSAGCDSVSVALSRDYDLTREESVARLFRDFQPDTVFHLAGLVGGILPNKERPAEYFYRNLMMGTLMLHYSSTNRVDKFIAAGAGCGYPEHAPIPLKETSFWDGLPQKESAPYSLAKRLLSVQSDAYYRQYGFVSIICIPGNIYGPWDNYNLLDAHVIPALVRKFVEASIDKAPSVEVWGSGTPSRDFVYTGDVAEGMLRAAEVYDRSEIVNMSSGTETTIRTVTELLKGITGFEGAIDWNTSRPDGQLRRRFDTSKAARELGFLAPTEMRGGLETTVAWYRANMNSTDLRK